MNLTSQCDSRLSVSISQLEHLNTNIDSTSGLIRHGLLRIRMSDLGSVLYGIVYFDVKLTSVSSYNMNT